MGCGGLWIQRSEGETVMSISCTGASAAQAEEPLFMRFFILSTLHSPRLIVSLSFLNE